MDDRCAAHILRAKKLTETMLNVALDLELNCRRAGCLNISGTIRDNAYKIRRMLHEEGCQPGMEDLTPDSTRYREKAL